MHLTLFPRLAKKSERKKIFVIGLQVNQFQTLLKERHALRLIDLYLNPMMSKVFILIASKNLPDAKFSSRQVGR